MKKLIIATLAIIVFSATSLMAEKTKNIELDLDKTFTKELTEIFENNVQERGTREEDRIACVSSQNGDDALQEPLSSQELFKKVACIINTSASHFDYSSIDTECNEIENLTDSKFYDNDLIRSLLKKDNLLQQLNGNKEVLYKLGKGIVLSYPHGNDFETLLTIGLEPIEAIALLYYVPSVYKPNEELGKRYLIEALDKRPGKGNIIYTKYNCDYSINKEESSCYLSSGFVEVHTTNEELEELRKTMLEIIFPPQPVVKESSWWEFCLDCFVKGCQSTK